jgi:hypothetical protein
VAERERSAHIEGMTFAPVHRSSDRRTQSDRREGGDRRSDSSATLKLVPVERRSGEERRRGERRVNPERRRQETTAEHIRNALQLLDSVSQVAKLDDQLQRDLDSAIFRLHFALDRLQYDEP